MNECSPDATPDELPNESNSSNLFSSLALIQAAYFILTGVWPLVNMDTFQKATGPKLDHWLVKTVGVLITVIGVTLGVAGLRRNNSAEIPLRWMSSTS